MDLLDIIKNTRIYFHIQLLHISLVSNILQNIHFPRSLIKNRNKNSQRGNPNFQVFQFCISITSRAKLNKNNNRPKISLRNSQTRAPYCLQYQCQTRKLKEKKYISPSREIFLKWETSNAFKWEIRIHLPLAWFNHQDK